MAGKRKKVTPWILVIILLIFFPLVGFILFIKKLYEDKEGAYRNSLVARCIASAILAIGIMLLLAVVTVEPSAYEIFICLFVLILPGSLLFIKGLNLKKDSYRYEKYIELITNYGVVSIDAIASEVSLPYAKTAKDLEGMVKVGYLNNAYIDHEKKMVIIEANRPIAFEGNRIQQNTSKAIVCKNCGGSNVVASGATVECEYCGSPISFS